MKNQSRLLVVFPAHRRAKMRVIFLYLSLYLSSCALFEDMSPETLHKDWVEEMRSNVGRKNMYDCTNWICLDRKRSHLGEVDLGNGLQEIGFRYGRFDGKNPNRFPQCKYFFTYEKSTGLIVGFRYEESKPLACRYSGA